MGFDRLELGFYAVPEVDGRLMPEDSQPLFHCAFSVNRSSDGMQTSPKLPLPTCLTSFQMG